MIIKNLNNLEPYEDETINSFLERYARANGFESIAEFFKYAVVLDPSDNRSSGLKFTEISRYGTLFEAIGIKNYAPFYRDHTFYSYMAIFLTRYQQVSVLNSAFCNAKKGSTPIPVTDYHCPECDKERRYIRRSHNLPGVKVCYKHGCSLYDADNKPLLDEVTADDIAFATYSHELLVNAPDINRNELGLSFTTDYEANVLLLMVKFPDGFIPDEPQVATVNSEGYKQLYETNNLSEYIHEDCGAHFCMTPYGMNYYFDCPICRPKDPAEAYARQMDKTGEYKLIKYSPQSVTLQHMVCGNTYTTRPASFFEGARCICQTQRTPFVLQQLNEKYPDFEFLEYDAKHTKETIRHKGCNQVFTVGLDKWLKNPHCPICDPRFLLEDDYVSEQVRHWGFKMISFNKDNYACTVECPNGHIFWRNYYHLRDNPTCPTCNKMSENSKTGKMLKKLKNSYGIDDVIFTDEYDRLTTRVIRSTYLRYPQFLYKLDNGVYGFRQFSKEEIFNQKFFERKGERIGYSYGTSFSYELGILKEKPDIPSIATTKSMQPDGMLSGFNGTEIRIKGVIKGFTKDNWKEAQVADYISGINRYSDNKEYATEVLWKYIKDNHLNLALIKSLLPKTNKYTDVVFRTFNEYMEEEEDDEA